MRLQAFELRASLRLLSEPMQSMLQAVKNLSPTLNVNASVTQAALEALAREAPGNFGLQRKNIPDWAATMALRRAQIIRALYLTGGPHAHVPEGDVRNWPLQDVRMCPMIYASRFRAFVDIGFATLAPGLHSIAMFSGWAKCRAKLGRSLELRSSLGAPFGHYSRQLRNRRRLNRSSLDTSL